MEKIGEWIISSYPGISGSNSWKFEMKQSSLETPHLERSGNQASPGHTCAGLRWHFNMLQILSEVAGRLLASDNPRQIVDQLCLKVMKFLECDVFFNYLVNADPNCLDLNACAGVSDQIAARIKTLDLGAAVCGCVARDGVRIVAENIYENPDPRTDLVRSLGIQAYACHPLRVGSRTIGTLSFGSRSRTQFIADELDMMKTVADHVAFAIDRVRAERERGIFGKALIESNRKIESILGSITDMFVSYDRQWRFTDINQVGENLTGWKKSVLIGQNVWHVFPELKESSFYHHYMRAAANNEPEHFEAYSPVTKNWHEVHAYPSEQGMQVYMRVITDRKEAQFALQKAKDDLEIKVRERTALLMDINSKLLAEIAERKKTEERLRSAQKNLRAMASEIVLSDERSRQHFAADLHDSVVQTLGAAKLRSELLREYVKPEGFNMIKELQNMISQSISQARFIMAEMSPPVLNELGFIPALEWLAEQIESQHGIEVNFSSRNNSQRMVHEVQVLLFQAVRELLMNIVKHSRAKQAFLKVSERAGKIRIEVKDNGIGMDKKIAFRSDLSSGFGLFSIKERLKHFGGQLKIESEHGKGTTVIIQAPKGEGNGN